MSACYYNHEVGIETRDTYSCLRTTAIVDNELQVSRHKDGAEWARARGYTRLIAQPVLLDIVPAVSCRVPEVVEALELNDQGAIRLDGE